MDEPGPEQLLAGLAAGQEAAFVALYRQFGDRLYRTALTLLTRSQDAEDAVQEVFVSLVRSQRRLPDVENLAAYLFASLRRAAGRIAARRARTTGMSIAVPDAGADAAAASCDLTTDQQADRRTWLRGALGRLPAEQREIIALKIDGELTFAEIAVALGISPNTAASRYRYALEKLRAAVPAQLKPNE